MSELGKRVTGQQLKPGDIVLLTSDTDERKVESIRDDPQDQSMLLVAVYPASWWGSGGMAQEYKIGKQQTVEIKEQGR